MQSPFHESGTLLPRAKRDGVTVFECSETKRFCVIHHRGEERVFVEWGGGSPVGDPLGAAPEHSELGKI